MGWQAGALMMERDAVISPDERYRYLLRRRWMPGPTFGFIMLNPSTADAQRDDPTIRRCIGFAGSHGCGSLLVVNLFALRTTHPGALLAKGETPVGPENDVAIIEALAECPIVVAAWGSFPYLHSKLSHRPEQVIRMALDHDHSLAALGKTIGGYPRHPLYLRSDQDLDVWQARPVRRRA